MNKEGKKEEEERESVFCFNGGNLVLVLENRDKFLESIVNSGVREKE